DFLIGSFLNRLKMLLKHLTIGRITVKGTESLSDEQKERQFLPAGLRAEPYDREDPEVIVMTDKHYRALKDSFCMYGHLDCIVDDTYGT
ncbi:unnamed protein product, partial [Effrenium voratum]